jgi:hypothetical protein
MIIFFCYRGGSFWNVQQGMHTIKMVQGKDDAKATFCVEQDTTPARSGMETRVLRVMATTGSGQTTLVAG